MTPEKLWSVLERYDRELAGHGCGVRQFGDEEYANRNVGLEAMFSHCRWMIQKCLRVFRAEWEAAGARTVKGTGTVAAAVAAREPLEKAMRWLGYIQGVCNALGVYSCNELRDHSRVGEEHKPVLVKIRNSVCRVDLQRYAEGGRVAITLIDTSDGAPYATASVNMPEILLADDEVLIKDYSENRGMLAALEASGVVVRTGKAVRTGFVQIPVAKLLLPPPPPKPTEPTEPSPAETMVDTAASILGLSEAETARVKRELAIKKAADTPPDRRTPEQVKLLNTTLIGCCDRHADHKACDCLAEAAQRHGASS